MDAEGALTVMPLTTVVAGSLAVSPSLCATAVTISSRETSATSTDQFPASSASVSTASSPVTVTVTIAPATAVPVMVVSPAVTGSMIGVAV